MYTLAMTIEDVNKLAILARIEMSDAEKTEFLGNMESILGYIDIIKKATVEGVNPEIGEVRNVMRTDENPHESGKYTEKILAQAPDTQDGYLKVKKIL
jgi:aspartyl-tRNA(Asn)/glutamyl-tRNA(Gln) amidotransferase subunit C